MKHLISIFIISVGLLMASCFDRQGPSLPGSSDETGVLRVTVNMGNAGKLAKRMKSATIEMANLILKLSAEGQSSITDTLTLSGGSQERTERVTYGNLASLADGQQIKWTLSINAEDKNGKVIHSGDTVFALIPNDTTEVALSLQANYSMFVANFYPIRDSVTRCEVTIDTGDANVDTSFTKQSLLGDTVTLSYDYLTASSSGIEHHIELNVYGESSGSDTLLYTGDTTILVRSGEDKKYKVYLHYVGPDTLLGTTTMVVTLGEVGTITVDGVMFTDVNIMIEKSGNGVISYSDSGQDGRVYKITATPDSGWLFAGWQVTSGSAAIADSTASSTIVTLKSGNATVLGTFIKMVVNGGQTLFSNYNINGVSDFGDSPENPTLFTVNAPIVVAYLENYHYYNGGHLPGTISLMHSDGTLYGPFQTTGSTGQGGVENAQWFCYPMVILKAGVYTVIDSDPSTWSHNYDSDNRGFTTVEGYPVRQDNTIANFRDDFDVSLDDSKWIIIAGGNVISISDGYLTMKDIYYQRINSAQLFSPMNGKIVVKARILFSGWYQKFGLNINGANFNVHGQTMGFYFDTFAEDDEGQQNQLRVVVADVPSPEKWTPLMVQSIPLAWNIFHILTIELSSNEVVFQIDDAVVARYSCQFTGSVPVGLWNDRQGTMTTDWVEVNYTLDK